MAVVTSYYNFYYPTCFQWFYKYQIYSQITFMEIEFLLIIITINNYWGQSWHRGIKCDCKIDWLWVRSPLEEMKYLFKFIFPFLRSSVEAKHGVEFCHLTRNASRIRQKVGNGVSYTRFPLPTLRSAGYSVKLIYFFIFLKVVLVNVK